MKYRNLHSKFAKALFLSAQKEKIEDKVLEEFTALEQLFQNETFREKISALSSLPSSELKTLLQRTFENILSPLLINLLIILGSRHLFSLIRGVYMSYQKLIFEKNQIDILDVVSARDLSDAEKKNILELLQKHNQKKIHIEFSFDTKLLSGLQIYKNTRLTDLSSRARLEKIRKNLFSLPL
ncbi:ATP synthase F1 subunit delta [Candidatus Peregrinibacteria bacterium]|nr:ATP synthase F1 subunit delta [Candidatus Peregrinibacteria bacterium]